MKLCGVKIIKNNQQLSLDYTFVSSDMTFDSLFYSIRNKELMNDNVKNAYFGKSENYSKNEMHRLPIQKADFSLGFLLDTVEGAGNFLIELENEDDIQDPAVNVSETLMAERHRVITPTRDVHKKPGPKKLWNWIIDTFLGTCKCHFYAQQESEMDYFMRNLHDVLWYLDGQQSKFTEVKPLPNIFVWENSFRILLDSNGHVKRSVPNMTAIHLLDKHLKLDNILKKSFTKTKEWAVARSYLLELRVCIAKYVNYLSNKSNKRLEKTTTNANDDSTITTIPVTENTSLLKSIYEQLNKKLQGLDDFVPFNVYAIAPTDKGKRFNFLNNMSLSYPIQLYRNPKKHFAFVWKIPVDSTNEKNFMQDTLKVIKEIDENEKKYHDDAMKERAADQFKNIRKYNRSLLTSLHILINGDGDENDETQEALLKEKITQYENQIQAGVNIEEIYETEKLQIKYKASKFDNFWDAAQNLIDTADATVPDERRHGMTTNISPMFTSQIDFYNLTKQKMFELYPESPDNNIPSLTWFRHQFTPYNLYLNTSKNYTGRFNACLRFQTRLLRKSHPDHHYGSKIFGYFKEFAQLLSGYCSIYLRDDKASIPVGPINTPTESVKRQKKVLNVSSNKEGLSAVDHDHSPQHLVPSVTVQIKTEKDEIIQWYGGIANVSIKCAIFEASSAYRHAAEFVKLYRMENDPKKIVFMYSDGGCDHNTSFIQVQLSLISTFLHLNLDGIVAARTPPYLSVINPAERVMSVLNLGLYGLALCQADLDKSEEILIKNLTSKTKWRSVADKESTKSDKDRIDYPALAKKATKSAVDLLEKRFKRLNFGDSNVVVMDSQVGDTMNILYDELKKIDESFNWKREKLSKAEVMNNTKFKSFIEDHVCEMTYSYQVKKCNKSDCQICLPIESPSEIFEKFKWLPAPQISTVDKSKYKDFTLLLSEQEDKPTELCKPSANKSKIDDKDDLPKIPFKTEINRARLAVRCVECGKGRILFAEKALTSTERTMALEWFTEYPYVCGTPLFSIGHDLNEKLYQLPNNTCAKSMTAMYFSCEKKNLKGSEKICSVCNELCEFAIENDDFGGLPRCEDCKGLLKVVQHRFQKLKKVKKT